jgi:crotonobetainyl-CoA:carnitine CoA-transferase CaiB-like acyl-CoA transferase
VDVALTESILSLMEGMLPEYGKLGIVKQPTGGGISTAAPSNAYPCADRQWILIAANSDPPFRQLAALIGRPELATDARFSNNPARVKHVITLDSVISSWTMTRPAAQAETELTRAGIPACKVYTAADIAADPQFKYRNMTREVPDPHFGSVLQSGVVPHFPDSPGAIRWPGAAIGQHGDEILSELACYTPDRIAALRVQKVLR